MTNLIEFKMIENRVEVLERTLTQLITLLDKLQNAVGELTELSTKRIDIMENKINQ